MRGNIDCQQLILSLLRRRKEFIQKNGIQLDQLCLHFKVEMITYASVNFQQFSQASVSMNQPPPVDNMRNKRKNLWDHIDSVVNTSV